MKYLNTPLKNLKPHTLERLLYQRDILVSDNLSSEKELTDLDKQICEHLALSYNTITAPEYENIIAELKLILLNLTGPK